MADGGGCRRRPRWRVGAAVRRAPRALAAQAGAWRRASSLAFLFIYGLIAWNGYLSLSASRLLPNYEFVGFEQYVRLFESERWSGRAHEPGHLRHACSSAARWPSACCWPILLDQKIRAEGVLRTIYLYPMALSLHRHRHGVEVDPQPGPGPRAPGAASGASTSFTFDWLVNPDKAIYCIVIAGVWQSAGFVMALFLAGLRGIDDCIIKAAQIDGASLPRIYWRIIIPSLRPVFFSTLMVLSHLAIKSFDLVMALTAGGPGFATDLPATFMYAMAFSRGQIGLGAAVGDGDAGHWWRPSSCPTSTPS